MTCHLTAPPSAALRRRCSGRRLLWSGRRLPFQSRPVPLPLQPEPENPLCHLHRDRKHGHVGIGNLSIEHLSEHHRERIHIHLMVVRVVLVHFGCGPARCAHLVE